MIRNSLFEIHYSYDRPGRSQAQAVERARVYVEQGANYVVSIDLSKFFDKELEKRGLRFVRYADDIAIFVRSKKAAERVLKSVSRFLQHRMKLQVNQTKSRADFPWKQWRLPRTKVKNLKRLGIRHADAVMLGNTRKGAWRVSRYQTMNYALPAQWFCKHYGLVRLR